MLHAELDISSKTSELFRVREFVAAYCRKGPILDEDSIGQLELAVNEAVANIMRHSHRGYSDFRIQIYADADLDRVTLQFFYDGDAFDPTGVSPPAFDGSREGGFGIYMISKCVDRVQYSRDVNGKNCISLIKNRLHPKQGETLSECI